MELESSNVPAGPGPALNAVHYMLQEKESVSVFSYRQVVPAERLNIFSLPFVPWNG